MNRLGWLVPVWETSCSRPGRSGMIWHYGRCFALVTQADYFLKELALGEYTMPIVGMMLLVEIGVTDPDITRGLR